MNTIKTALMSKTVWTIFAMFLVGGVNAVQSFIPAGDLIYVQGFLGLMAVWFKLNPSQTY